MSESLSADVCFYYLSIQSSSALITAFVFNTQAKALKHCYIHIHNTEL